MKIAEFEKKLLEKGLSPLYVYEDNRQGVNFFASVKRVNKKTQLIVHDWAGRAYNSHLYVQIDEIEVEYITLHKLKSYQFLIVGGVVCTRDTSLDIEYESSKGQ